MQISQNNWGFYIDASSGFLDSTIIGIFVCSNTTTYLDSEKTWEIIKSVGPRLCV